MLTWLRSFLVIFLYLGLLFFVLKSILGIARQWNISNVGYSQWRFLVQFSVATFSCDIFSIGCSIVLTYEPVNLAIRGSQNGHDNKAFRQKKIWKSRLDVQNTFFELIFIQIVSFTIRNWLLLCFWVHFWTIESLHTVTGGHLGFIYRGGGRRGLIIVGGRNQTAAILSVRLELWAGKEGKQSGKPTALNQKLAFNSHRNSSIVKCAGYNHYNKEINVVSLKPYLSKTDIN